MPSMHAYLQNLAGKTMQLQLHIDCRANELRRLIEDGWQIPALCQKLVFDTSVIGPDDNPALLSFCYGDVKVKPVLTGSIIVEMELVYQRIQRKACFGNLDSLRREAIRTLATQLESLSDNEFVHATSVLLECTKDVFSEVRLVVVHALSSERLRNNDRVVAAFRSLLAHEHDTTVWQAAVQGLRLLDPEGHVQTVSLVQKALLSESMYLRRAAVDSLTQIAQPGEYSTIGALRKLLLKEEDPMVWKEAVQSLFLLDPDGNSQTMLSAQAVLTHDDGRLRQAAVNTLTRIAPQGDDRTVTELRLLIKSETDPNVWQAAVQALYSLHPEGVALTMSSARACLEHDDWRFRRAAVDALSKIVSDGGDGVVDDVIACFGDVDSTVRWTAVHASGEMAKIGDKRTLVALRALMSKRGLSTHERRAVVETLIKLTPEEEREVLSKWLTDRDTDVRRVMGEAFVKFALTGDTHAVPVLRSCLNHKCSVTARQALTEVAKQGHKEAQAVVRDPLFSSKFTRRT